MGKCKSVGAVRAGGAGRELAPLRRSDRPCGDRGAARRARGGPWHPAGSAARRARATCARAGRVISRREMRNLEAGDRTLGGMLRMSRQMRPPSSTFGWYTRVTKLTCARARGHRHARH